MQPAKSNIFALNKTENTYRQTRRQKVLNRGALRFCGGALRLSGGSWHKKIDKNSTDYSVSCFNLGELGALSGETKPAKDPPWWRDCL